MKSKTLISVSLVLAILGFLAWIYEVSAGHISSGLSNVFPWGLYIVVWVLLAGVAMGSMMIATSIRLFKIESLKSIEKLAIGLSLVSAIGAALAIIPDLGKPGRLIYVIIYPNLRSPIAWDAYGLIIFIILSYVYLLRIGKAEIAKNGIKLGFGGTIMKKDISDSEYKALKEQAEQCKILPVVLFIWAILMEAVGAWIFSVNKSNAWWYGGLKFPEFLLAALILGSSGLILASLFVSDEAGEVKKAITPLSKLAGYSAIALIVVHLFGVLNKLWWGDGFSYESAKLLISNYIVMYLIEIILLIYAAYVFIKKADNVTSLKTPVFVAFIGLIIHRLLLLYAGFNNYAIKMSLNPTTMKFGYITESLRLSTGIFDGKHPLLVTHYSYFPSLVEIVVAIGLISLVFFLFYLFVAGIPTEERS
jgi:molybdopterin-containing oxidoreductase family membrane subunit